jgi:hypothetical protein
MRFASASPSLATDPSRGRVAKRRRGVRGGPLVLLAAATLGLAACGGDQPGESARSSETVGVGPVRAGSTAQLASCRHWRRGTVEERYATIADIRGQLTVQTDPDAVSDLPDEAAYEVFERVCAPGYSDSFRLYKIYARAQAFAPLRTDLEQ